jgi:hypothetical protein
VRSATYRKLGGPISAVPGMMAMAMSSVELSDSDDERGANVVEGDSKLRVEGLGNLYGEGTRTGVALAMRFTRVAPGPQILTVVSLLESHVFTAVVYIAPRTVHLALH